MADTERTGKGLTRADLEDDEDLTVGRKMMRGLAPAAWGPPAQEVVSERDPYGANRMDDEQMAELRARLVAEALEDGRRCEICPDPPAEIVLNFEVEHLLCAAHAVKARRLHDYQVDFWGAEPVTSRIIRWAPDRHARYERRRQRHLR